MTNVELAIPATAAYTVAGSVFAVVFLTRGIGEFDAGARNAGWAFRLIVFPGVAALWPDLLFELFEWRRKTRIISGVL